MADLTPTRASSLSGGFSCGGAGFPTELGTVLALPFLHGTNHFPPVLQFTSFGPLISVNAPEGRDL